MNRRALLATMIVGAICITVSNLEAAVPQERDAIVTLSGVEIACRFTMPQGAARGAVLLLPGSLYSDVDGNYPSMNLRPHAYADLARQLGERGFAVLRMAMQRRLDANPGAMRLRRQTVEHPFGTLKARMGAAHFLTKTLPRVSTEMALHVLAHNLTRVLNIVGYRKLMAAIAT